MKTQELDKQWKTATGDGKPSGLGWGYWYCPSKREQCHYLGHHEGFHHLLYWDALVAFAEKRTTGGP